MFFQGLPRFETTPKPGTRVPFAVKLPQPALEGLGRIRIAGRNEGGSGLGHGAAHEVVEGPVAGLDHQW